MFDRISVPKNLKDAVEAASGRLELREKLKKAIGQTDSLISAAEIRLQETIAAQGDAEAEAMLSDGPSVGSVEAVHG